MTIEEAIKDLFESEKFINEAKTNSTFRSSLARYRTGELKTQAMVDLLLKFGYIITVTKGKKKAKKK